METINLFWNPDGFELDTLGRKTYNGPPADGDTPYVRMAIRMLSIDTPETIYPTIGKPSNSDDRLKELGEWITADKVPIDPKLGAFLTPKLTTGQAGTLQQEQGEEAKKEFKKLLDNRLTRPSGSRRGLFLRTADQPFDSFGRLLAYAAPSYSKKELGEINYKDRYTFNLNMLESGWAAPLIVYPSLPKHSDLILAHDKSMEALKDKKGAWADEKTLTGYEWRMCIKLHQQMKKLNRGDISYINPTSWISRYCFDMASLKIYYPQDYYKVQPYNRIFVWPRDVRKAVGELSLTSG